MVSKSLISALLGTIFAAVFLVPVGYIFGPENVDSTIPLMRHRFLQVWIGVAVYQIVKWTAFRLYKNRRKSSLYNLQHGRLHIHAPTPMWMNMGYWDLQATKSMAQACRDLLNTVLAEAGFSQEEERREIKNNSRRSKCLVDVGFGCGDQTIYLMSGFPTRRCDEEWWDEREHCVTFDKYIGITKDSVQARYASERIEELRNSGDKVGQEKPYREADIHLFCADAANPALWNQQVQTIIQSAKESMQDCWILALDTAYHFSPSRWPLIQYAHSHLDASFMAFDLCLSESTSWHQRLVLGVLTTLMGAPWTNFVTLEEYREKLVQCGYRKEMITIKDISEHVFSPLAKFIEQQDERLQMLGLDVGSFGVARAMFSWWARTGIVRGIIVVARKSV